MNQSFDAEENPSSNISTRDHINFLQLLQNTVDRKGNSTFATWYDKHGKPQNKYTFNELWNEAGYIAHDLLANHDLSKGDRVILCYGFGLQFFAAFLGCLRAGVVAVLIYPPSPSNMTKSLDKMNKVVNDSKPKLILIDGTINLLRINPLAKTRHLWPKDVTWKVHPKMPKNIKMKSFQQETFLAGSGENPQTSSSLNWASIVPEDIAFLQYTSGSTGDPKGVMVSFRALHANVKAIHDGAQPPLEKQGIMQDDIVGFSWLPQYHDMGLVYAVIAPFAGGWKCNMISPITFVQNPMLWIELISKLHVNWTVAPNFAFRLTARKFMEAKAKTNTEPIPNLDLRSLKYMQNSAEPIQTDTKDMFERAFKQYGLNDDWFVGAYGLAESVVGVTFLFEYKMSTYTPNGSTSLVAVGHKSCFPKGQTIKIIDTNTFNEVKEREVGEIWLSGPSVTSGYFGKPQLTQEVFHAKLDDDDRQYLRTGDLAFMEDGYLYICGRLKDIVIVNGVNYYPQDIEHAVENASPGVRPGCVAAFSSDDVGGDGDLEIVFEVRKSHENSVHDVAAKVHDAVTKNIGIVPSKVVAIKERFICKTTSGKIQRKASRRALHNDEHPVLHTHTSQSSRDPRPNKQAIVSSSSEPTNDTFDSIIFSYFGTNINLDQSWDELGMSSMVSVQLRDSISDAFPVTLPPDVFEQYSSPSELKVYVYGSRGISIMTNLDALNEVESKRVTWSILGVLQLLGGLLLLLMFSIGIVPAFYIGKQLLQINISIEIPTIRSSSTVDWIWVPLVIPAWMLSFSLCVIVLKWTLIGKYKEGKVQVQSLVYARWWFVDRAIALWEAWIGRFILDTPVLNAFYIVMGAKINMNTHLNAFIREFDLVTIEGFSSINHPINCRKFGTWTEEESPSLRFRSILIGNACEIKGMVSPGSTIGEGSYVESLSVVPEGAQVPELSEVAGNPAFITGKSKPYENETNQFVLGILKVLWLVFELYLFFATVLLGQYLWVPYLPQWRYSSLLMWFLLILWFASVSIGTSVCLKWILIGKQRPGKINQTLTRDFSHWAADWHFTNALQLVRVTGCGGRIWNLILKLHGLDIDFISVFITPELITPSKVDLISIKESMISIVHFKVECNDCLHQITIERSSVGYGCQLEACNRHLSITRALISPYSRIVDSIDSNDDRAPSYSTSQMLCIDAGLFLLSTLFLIGGIFCSLIPSYELWDLCWNSESIWIAVPLLAITIMVQTIALSVIIRLLMPFGLMPRHGTSEARNRLLFIPYVRLHFSLINVFAIPVEAFRGSSVYNLLLKFLGVQFEGRAIVLDQSIKDHMNINIKDKTIIDASSIRGHYGVFDKVIVGKSNLSGLLQRGTRVSCGTTSGPETDAYRAYVGEQASSANSKKETFEDDLYGTNPLTDIENPNMHEAAVDTFETNPRNDLRSSVNSDYYDYGYSDSESELDEVGSDSSVSC